MPASKARRLARSGLADTASQLTVVPGTSSSTVSLTAPKVQMEKPGISPVQEAALGLPCAASDTVVDAADATVQPLLVPPPPPPAHTLPPAEIFRRQAQRENLKLVKASNSSGYLGVRVKMLECHPYKAWIAGINGRIFHLGYFGCAEEAALVVARKRKELFQSQDELGGQQRSDCPPALQGRAEVKLPSDPSSIPEDASNVVPHVASSIAAQAIEASFDPSAHSMESIDEKLHSGILSAGASPECGTSRSSGEPSGTKRKRKNTPTHREAKRRCKARARQRKLGMVPTF